MHTFEQSYNISAFNSPTSWIVLSEIEQRIKDKIEAIGTPLKEWDISINRGILTGYNEAFIIDNEKREELIRQDPKSAEIIRPLLRGRDIKRYSYDYAELYIISTFPSQKIDIEMYPAVKKHLINFGYDRLEQSGNKGSRKKTNNQWFETQDSIGYMDDFFKHKIVYPNMTKFLPFLFDDKAFFTNQKCFIITGENIEYLTAFLNSSLFKYCFRDNFPELQGGTRELSKVFFEQVSVKQIETKENEIFKKYIMKIQELKSNNTNTKELEIELDNLIFDLYGLSQCEKAEIGFIEIA